MLLIDNVEYRIWVPPSEDAFEQIVEEHAHFLFDMYSEYFGRKQKLKSLSGVASIPDGYVLLFQEKPRWAIVEVELSSHPLHEHIVSQLSKFINGIKNPQTQREVVGALYAETMNDVTLREIMESYAEEFTQSREIYKFITDLVSKPPVLVIVIEKSTPQLHDAVTTLAHPEIEIVELQTFVKIVSGPGGNLEAAPDHVHLFEPLRRPIYKTTKATAELPKANGTDETSFEVFLKPSHVNQTYIHVPAANKTWFPRNGKIELQVGNKMLETKFCDYDQNGRWLQGGQLKEFFDSEPNPQVGDKIRLTVIEPMKKYRLEIIKS